MGLDNSDGSGTSDTAPGSPGYNGDGGYDGPSGSPARDGVSPDAGSVDWGAFGDQWSAATNQALDAVSGGFTGGDAGSSETYDGTGPSPSLGFDNFGSEGIASLGISGMQPMSVTSDMPAAAIPGPDITEHQQGIGSLGTMQTTSLDNLMPSAAQTINDFLGTNTANLAPQGLYPDRNPYADPMLSLDDLDSMPPVALPETAPLPPEHPEIRAVANAILNEARGVIGKNPDAGRAVAQNVRDRAAVNYSGYGTLPSQQLTVGQVEGRKGPMQYENYNPGHIAAIRTPELDAKAYGIAREMMTYEHPDVVPSALSFGSLDRGANIARKDPDAVNIGGNTFGNYAPLDKDYAAKVAEITDRYGGRINADPSVGGTAVGLTGDIPTPPSRPSQAEIDDIQNKAVGPESMLQNMSYQGLNTQAPPSIDQIIDREVQDRGILGTWGLDAERARGAYNKEYGNQYPSIAAPIQDSQVVAQAPDVRAPSEIAAPPASLTTPAPASKEQATGKPTASTTGRVLGTGADLIVGMIPGIGTANLVSKAFGGYLDDDPNTGFFSGPSIGKGVQMAWDGQLAPAPVLNSSVNPGDYGYGYDSPTADDPPAATLTAAPAPKSLLDQYPVARFDYSRFI